MHTQRYVCANTHAHTHTHTHTHIHSLTHSHQHNTHMCICMHAHTHTRNNSIILGIYCCTTLEVLTDVWSTIKMFNSYNYPICIYLQLVTLKTPLIEFCKHQLVLSTEFKIKHYCWHTPCCHYESYVQTSVNFSPTQSCKFICQSVEIHNSYVQSKVAK